MYRDSFRFCGRESFLLREENDRCTRTWCGLIHKLFFLQEDDDLFISNIRLINLKGNKLVLAGAFDVRKLLKRYSTLTPHKCGNMYD